MSLFPAYSGASNPSDAEKDGTSWLNNESYERKSNSAISRKENTASSQQDSLTNRDVSGDCELGSSYKNELPESHKKSVKHKKKDRKKHKKSGKRTANRKYLKAYKQLKQYEKDNTRNESKDTFARVCLYENYGLYSVDMRYDRYSDINERDNVPLYSDSIRMISLTKKSPNLKCKKKRYFDFNRGDPNNMNETELQEATAKYNQRIALNAHDVDLWVEYINFQDNYQYMLKSSERNSAIAEKKLAIVNKALIENSSSEKLLSLQFNLLAENSSYDIVYNELLVKTRRDSSLISWNQFIRLTQYSSPHFNIQKVIGMYKDALRHYSQVKRSEILFADRCVLSLYQDCMLVIRHGSYWELMCSVICIYIEKMFLGPCQKVRINVEVEEDKIKELENGIMLSEATTNEKWICMEKLLEKVHWCPVYDLNCEYPMRIVLEDDVTELIKPISSPSLNLQFVVISLASLKVPLLPLRHCLFHFLQLGKSPWCLDSPEMLLSLFFNQGIAQTGDLKDSNKCIMLNCIRDLVTAPQYVNVDIGQEEFQEYIYNIFKTIYDNITGDSQIIVLCWWLRFERLLLTLQKKELPRNLRLRQLVKHLLKNRRNGKDVLLYIEYALIEKELCGSEKYVEILKTSLSISAQTPVTKLNSDLKPYYTILYRTYCQQLFQLNRKEECLQWLTKLALGMTELPKIFNEDVIHEASLKFEEIITLYLWEHDFQKSATLEDLMLPHFFPEWVVCYIMYMYLTKSAESALSYLQKIMDKFPPFDADQPVTLSYHFREILTETCIDILYDDLIRNGSSLGMFRKNIYKSVAEFPNNLFLLRILSNIETNLMLRNAWWKTRMCLEDKDSYITKVMLVLITYTQFVQQKEIVKIKGADLQKDALACEDVYEKYRLGSLLSRLTKNYATKHCPLVWKIYLQYVAAYESARYKDVFYMAVESCPWAKMIYLECAQQLPEEVPKIEELLTEKDFRIHITTDELNV